MEDEIEITLLDFTIKNRKNINNSKCVSRDELRTFTLETQNLKSKYEI